MIGNKSIVSRPGLLAEEYFPAQLPGREEQAQRLEDCLAPALRGRKPFHAWVHGSPGSGKTTMVRSVLAQLKERHGVRSVFVNALHKRTFYSVVDQVLDELRVVCGDEKDTSWKLEVLGRYARAPLIIAIDEIDQIPPKERNPLLYNLASLDLVGLVLVSQSRDAIEVLDSRVLSRLSPRTIECSAYPEPMLVEILRARAADALVPESWVLATIERIAQQANGDARLAIQVLRAAAYRAERHGSSYIEESHVDFGLGAVEVQNLKHAYAIRKMPDQERILYELVAATGRVLSRDLYHAWIARCSELGLEPMSRRTFKDYHLRLRRAGLIREIQATGRGRGFWLEATS